MLTCPRLLHIATTQLTSPLLVLTHIHKPGRHTSIPYTNRLLIIFTSCHIPCTQGNTDKESVIPQSSRWSKKSRPPVSFPAPSSWKKLIQTGTWRKSHLNSTSMGIIRHIRDRWGYPLDSHTLCSHLANYWRTWFGVPTEGCHVRTLCRHSTTGGAWTTISSCPCHHTWCQPISSGSRPDPSGGMVLECFTQRKPGSQRGAHPRNSAKSSWTTSWSAQRPCWSCIFGNLVRRVGYLGKYAIIATCRQPRDCGTLPWRWWCLTFWPRSRSSSTWPFDFLWNSQTSVTSLRLPKKPRCCGACVCVWNIWTDVKLLPYLFAFWSAYQVWTFQIGFAGGSGRSLGTATNEDTHLIWWYRFGRQSAYLQCFFHSSSMASGQA